MDNAAAFVDRAREAQRVLATLGQDQIDELVTAVAWVGVSNAEALAKMAVDETGIGNVEDKIRKNRRKTMGTLRDLKRARSVGVIREDPEYGVTEIAKPVGVVGAITPVTNPGATPINNIMIVLKGANAIILAPHPKADATCAEIVRLVHAELDKLDVPRDAVQQLSLKAEDKSASKARAQELMEHVDLVVATAGPQNVRAAYRSGTPALGVGRGNVPVIVDETANIGDAADKILLSASFDYATSCSSENSLIINDAVFDAFVEELCAKGAHLASPSEKARLRGALWNDAGALSRDAVAKSPEVLCRLAGIDDPEVARARLFLVEEEGVGKDFPFSGEKLAPVVSLYRYESFEDALKTLERILDYQGLGHSCGIHSHDDGHIEALAERAKVCRVLVNQAHCIGAGGDFANGLDFTLSLAAGTWGDNSVPDNITYRHFLNVTRLARPIPAREPTEDELFGEYRKRHG